MLANIASNIFSMASLCDSDSLENTCEIIDENWEITRQSFFLNRMLNGVQIKIYFAEEPREHFGGPVKERHNVSRALGVIRRYCNRLWIFCGDYAFRVFDRHPRGKRDIVEDQSKAKLLPPMCTKTFIYGILYCLK